VPVAKAVFDEHKKGPNQIQRPAKQRAAITEKDLVEIPRGQLTEEGFVRNVDVALQYIESWLRGNGCVPIYNLMEDSATAEISRAQLWQWIRYGARLNKWSKDRSSQVRERAEGYSELQKIQTRQRTV
jgi:malate synthase